MISFDNSFFFDTSLLNFKNDTQFKKNLKISKDKSDELLDEFKNNKNEILRSFSKPYQKKN